MYIPDGKTLWNEYLKFDGQRQVCLRMKSPGKLLVKNQCAVRMSVALGRSNCGFNFVNWRIPPFGYIHRHGGRGTCSGLPSHVTGSTDLVTYLEDEGLSFNVYTKSRALTASNIKAEIRGQMGIIYFGLCFGVRGSHIDFWNGSHFMNQVLRFSAGGGLPSSSDLFATARGEIKFSPTP